MKRHEQESNKFFQFFDEKTGKIVLAFPDESKYNNPILKSGMAKYVKQAGSL
jgi:hypothetical protein